MFDVLFVLSIITNRDDIFNMTHQQTRALVEDEKRVLSTIDRDTTGFVILPCPGERRRRMKKIFTEISRHFFFPLFHIICFPHLFNYRLLGYLKANS
jgi:hypothetical protein